MTRKLLTLALESQKEEKLHKKDLVNYGDQWENDNFLSFMVLRDCFELELPGEGAWTVIARRIAQQRETLPTSSQWLKEEEWVGIFSDETTKTPLVVLQNFAAYVVNLLSTEFWIPPQVRLYKPGGGTLTSFELKLGWRHCTAWQQTESTAEHISQAD